MVGGGKGEASHDVIDVQFFSVGCEDQVVAVLTYVNGFGDELIFRDGDHTEVSVGDGPCLIPTGAGSRHRGMV